MQEEQSVHPAVYEEEKNHRLFKRYFLFFIVLFLVVGSFWIGYTNGQKSTESANQSYPIDSTVVTNKFLTGEREVDFDLFWKVWDLLKEKYVNHDSLDAQELVYGAIKGMLAATKDPYTTFFDPKETQEFDQDISGSFEGIGAELGVKDGILTVIAPLDGSPSQKAGLLAGDKILQIDGKSTTDVSIDQAVDLIRGKKGSQVKLVILHKGDQETTEISITREMIKVKSVKIEFKENNIAYLKINQFGEKTSD
ncbi:MAG: PDZ domain-containing protein, partial [bacterium]|nr:PDZ domain-containing protein [bacterium]